MSLRLEHLIKPFTAMSEDEQLELINRVRYNRFVVKATMAEAAAEKVEAKKAARAAAKPAKATKETKTTNKAAVMAMLKGMTDEQREALLAKVMGAGQ